MQGEVIIFCIFLVDLFQFVFLKKSKKKKQILGTKSDANFVGNGVLECTI